MSRVPPSRPKDRYGDRGAPRLALAPGLLCALVLLAGVAAIDTDWYLLIQFLVAILVIIMGVFAVQGRAWWWLLPLAAVAVLWNPVVPLALPGAWQLGAHYVGIAIVAVAGAFIKVPEPVHDTRRSRR